MNLSAQTSTRQAQKAQIIYNQQNVRTQKEKITLTTNQRPTKCGEIESPCHYLNYKDYRMQIERVRLQTYLQKAMKKIHTRPGIILVLLQ